ncbi:MAG: glycosyltransferase family 2 protein, partial [Pirellula sp.]
MSADLKYLIVPVAYNEEKKIRSVFERILEVTTMENVLLLNDASTDTTPEVAREFGAKVLTQKKRLGVGAAIRLAINYARSNGFDIIVILAGNDKDRPSDIPRLVQPIIDGDADFVQGSRYLPGGDFGNMPYYRQLSTRWVHPILMSIVCRRRITDSTN